MDDLKENLKKIGEKLPPTQSQRLRASLYRLWEINKLPDETFDKYYHDRMEDLIRWVQKKLPR